MARQRWRVRLGEQAELDFANILKWTTENFGASQALVYNDTLVEAIRALAQGPSVHDAKARDDIMQGLYTLHVARRGRRGRHILLFRIAQAHMIEIGRILHDGMELTQHMPFFSDEHTDDKG